jgi:hypothetical protein
MTEEPTKTEPTGVFQCEGLAFAILHAFAERLSTEAEKTDGAITVERIQAMVRTFGAEEAEHFRANFRTRLEDFLTQREKEFWDQNRKRPFDRVLVKRFAHLLAPEGGLGTEGPLSRRLLPGFFLSMEKLAGPELFSQCQRACKGILRAKREEPGADAGDLYDQLYDSEEANVLVDDVLVVVASHFAEFDQRVDWLHDLINNHLGIPEDYEFEGPAVHTWRLEREGLLDLLGGLFASIREKMTSEPGRDQIQKRYGQKARGIIETLLVHLDEAD